MNQNYTKQSKEKIASVAQFYANDSDKPDVVFNRWAGGSAYFNDPYPYLKYEGGGIVGVFNTFKCFDHKQNNVHR